MNTTINLQSKLLTLRRMLPHGSIGKIAKKVGCSRATVEHVIRGKSDHPGVIEEILEIIKHKESYKEALTKKIEEVVNGR